MTDEWPPHSHRGDPETSHAAADLLDPRRDVELVTRFYVDHDRPQGWTRGEVLNTIGGRLADDNRFAKRLSDAETRGFVTEVFDADSSKPVTRIGPHNRQQRALRVTDRGRAWLAGGAAPSEWQRPAAPRRRPLVQLTDAEAEAVAALRREREQDSAFVVCVGIEVVDRLLALFERLA